MVFARSKRQVVRDMARFNSQPCGLCLFGVPPSRLIVERSNMCSSKKRLERLATGASVVWVGFAATWRWMAVAEVDSRRTPRHVSCDERLVPIIRHYCCDRGCNILSLVVRHRLSPTFQITTPDPANKIHSSVPEILRC